ncbi:MAG: hypothetical protein ACP5D2_04915 [Candidatus Nanoarchaeia archaeon]
MVEIRQHPITGEFLIPHEYDMTTRAYEMMTPEQIRMSDEREHDYKRRCQQEFAEEVLRSERNSRQSMKKDKKMIA